MPRSPRSEKSQIRCQRLNKMLEDLGAQGVTQSDVARRSQIPAQYLTDLKKGNRPVTELCARRLGDAFGVEHRWLLGEVGTMDGLRLGQEVAEESSGSVWLPVFPHPVQGPPRSLAKWDGSSVEVCGAAAARVRAATQPYVLRFGRDDRRGRLQHDDLLLISQSIEKSAEFQVVRHNRTCFLARQVAEGVWQRLVEEKPLAGPVEAVGHVMGIVWAAL